MHSSVLILQSAIRESSTIASSQQIALLTIYCQNTLTFMGLEKPLKAAQLGVD